MTLPPLEEQKRIEINLADAVARLDSISAKAFGTVTLLQERRAALISAAVTGKIDVRTWQPPEPQPVRQSAAEVA